MDADSSAAAELVERLAAIGIEEREAKLFVHLSMNGPSRASDAAAATHLKRTETYRALEALMKRGFVTAHLARPVVYEAVQPDALFRELLASHEQRKSEMEKLREEISSAVASARRSAGAPSARYGYKIVQGRRAILGAAESAVRAAKRMQITVNTAFDASAVTAQNRAYQATLRRASEGLPTRLLFRESPGLERAIAPLTANDNVEVRFFKPDQSYRFTILDEREIIYWLVHDPAPGIDARDDVAMWTNAPDFVKAQDTLFQALWVDARPVTV